MDNRIGEMQVFLRVVEAGSFSEAARQLLMTPSTVSKVIGRIEERLGVRLLERSTRRLSLTAEGQIYAERGRTVLETLEDIEQDLSHGAAQLGGVVRVSTSVGLGIVALEPLLPAFWDAYPNIVIDLSLSDDIVDLYLDHTDVAFRVGALNNSRVTALKLGSPLRKVVAAPAYLERYGRPQTLDDLRHHKCLGFNFRRSSALWPLREGGRVADRLVDSPIRANNGETNRRMALAGVGMARIGEFHVREDLQSGALEELVIDGLERDREDVNALFLGGERMPSRVRVFLDFMTPRLRAFLAAGG